MQVLTQNNSGQRKLAAVMFADMTGYTAMMQEDEVQANILRTRQKQILDSLIPAHQGTIIQYFGDGTLSIFESSANAVRCGIAIQIELQKEPKVKLRIGIHSGDIVYDKEGIYGDCVNIASRIETLSVPGAVLFSAKVYDEIKNQKDIKAKSIGKYHLKNVQHPLEVYAASNEGLVIPAPSEIHGKTEESPLFTPSSFAIWRSVFFVSLYCIVDVLEITFKALILESSVISVSCMPDTKYCCDESPERFSSGNTAMDSNAVFFFEKRTNSTTIKIITEPDKDATISLTDLFLNKEVNKGDSSVFP